MRLLAAANHAETAQAYYEAPTARKKTGRSAVKI
jgi:hypothetical protein